MAKQPGRRGSERPQSLRIAAYVLLAGGVVLVGAAMVSTATRLEAAGDGLLLIGIPLLLLGAGLMGLDWISSYSAAAEGSWDHHETASAARPDARAKVRRGAASSRQPAPRPPVKRLRMFGGSQVASDFGPSGQDTHAVDAASTPSSPAGAATRAAAPVPAAAAAPAFATAASATSAPTAASTAATTAAISAASTTPSAASTPAGARSRLPPEPVAVPEQMPDDLRRVDPGPETMIEEFVGYEGQDRMLAGRQAALPPPRELAWPNPPRQAVDVSAQGNEVFIEKLMDDVLARIGTPQESVAMAMAMAAPAIALGPESAHSRLPSAAFTAAARAAHRAAQEGTRDAAPSAAQAPVAHTVHPGSAQPAPLWAATPVADAAPPLTAWTRQTLHRADHWRFAALVEKLYQQAGFATQLQAGQTMRGVVVLWLFSRHRPGMPASVVSCVHSPGDLLAADEITAVADLVKTRGLPRGQLATTAHIDAAGHELAAQQRVHVMDTERLLKLITQRSAEQQRALADRLA